MSTTTSIKTTRPRDRYVLDLLFKTHVCKYLTQDNIRDIECELTAGSLPASLNFEEKSHIQDDAPVSTVWKLLRSWIKSDGPKQEMLERLRIMRKARDALISRGSKHVTFDLSQLRNPEYLSTEMCVDAINKALQFFSELATSVDRLMIEQGEQKQDTSENERDCGDAVEKMVHSMILSAGVQQRSYTKGVCMEYVFEHDNRYHRRRRRHLERRFMGTYIPWPRRNAKRGSQTRYSYEIVVSPMSDDWQLYSVDLYSSRGPVTNRKLIWLHFS